MRLVKPVEIDFFIFTFTCREKSEEAVGVSLIVS